MERWNYIKLYYPKYSLFLLVNVATLFIIWNTNPFVNCDIFSDKFWQNTNLLIENIINILKPSWPLTALIVGVLFIFNFKSEISKKIADITSIKTKDGNELQFQPSTPKDKIEDPRFAADNNDKVEYTEPADLEAIKDEIKRLKVIVDNALKRNLGDKDSILLELTRTLAINNFRLHCEMWYKYIYGGQIRLLKLLQNNDGITWEMAEVYFEKEVEKYPEIKQYQPDVIGYISFLKSAMFCDFINNKIIITNNGSGFLKWLEANNFTENHRIF